MHYKNGTQAKEGDAVIVKDWRGVTRAGVIHELNEGATTCNAQVALTVPGGVVHIAVNVGDIYSAVDAFKLIDDTNKEAQPLKTEPQAG